MGLLLNITDKAISKWECGCNLPDHDVMVNLCNELGITVNELLSGGICSFIYFVQWLEHANNAGYFGPNLANIVIGIFYSFLISAVILVLKERI